MIGSRIRAVTLTMLVTALMVLAVGAQASTAASYKPYSIVICGGGQTGCSQTNPAVIAPGGTLDNPSSLSVTFSNDNRLGTGIQVGSDNLSVPNPPPGFSVIGTSLPACPPAFNNSAPPCFILLNNGATVGFRNLNLMPGQSISISMSAITPAPSTTFCTTTSPCFWSDQARQSNDFAGAGNGLNSDGNSSYGTVMSAVATCQPQQTCTTTLANGGAANSAPGSISTTIDTSSGQTLVTQVESIDFGAPLVGPQDPNECSGVTSPHLTFYNLFNGADNGSDRSETVTINTTNFAGYESEVCFETNMPFTQLVIAPDGTESLAPADQVGNVFVGLLPDCATSELQANLQVDCNTNPGVLQRENVGEGDPVHTVVVAVPPGFDPRLMN